jgi:hypothetical protein
MLFYQQHGMPGAPQNIRRRQPRQAAANDNDVILLSGAFQKVFGHE